MKVISQRFIVMADDDPVAGTAKAMTVMADNNQNNFAAPSRRNFGADVPTGIAKSKAKRSRPR